MLLKLSLNFHIQNFQATAAFDGTRMSKWEEPNGARGIMIKEHACFCPLFNQLYQNLGGKLCCESWHMT